MKDYYRLLEVSETASTEVIQAAYKIMAKKYHPDTAKPEDKAQRELRMKEINRAKEILLNPDERRRYDNELMLERARIREESIRAKAEKHKIKEGTKKKNQRINKPPEVDNEKEAVGGAFVGFNAELNPEFLYKSNDNLDWTFATDYTGSVNDGASSGFMASKFTAPLLKIPL